VGNPLETETRLELSSGNPDFDALLRKMAMLHRRKNHDYSYSTSGQFYSNFRECCKLGIPAWKGILIRMSDKWARIMNFAGCGHLKVTDETVVDTLLDLAVYSLLCLLVYEKEQMDVKEKKNENW